MIQMVSGSTRVGTTTYTPASGAFSTGQAVEERLVRLGVAQFVGETALAADEATVSGVSNGGQGSYLPDGENAVEVEEIDLGELSFDELKEIAQQNGVNTKGLRSKAALIEAITGNAAPVLSAEDPV